MTSWLDNTSWYLVALTVLFGLTHVIHVACVTLLSLCCTCGASADKSAEATSSTNPPWQRRLAQEVMVPVSWTLQMGTLLWFSVEYGSDNEYAPMQFVFWFLFVTALVWLLARFLGWLTQLCERAIDRSTKERARQVVHWQRSDAQVSEVIQGVMRLLLYVMVIVFAVQKSSVDTTGWLTALGLSSIALGIVAQNLLQNMLGSLTVLSNGLYAVGDLIQVAGCLLPGAATEVPRGTVVHIGLTHTYVRDDDGCLYMMPNSLVASVTTVKPSHGTLTAGLTKTIDLELPFDDAVAEDVAGEQQDDVKQSSLMLVAESASPPTSPSCPKNTTTLMTRLLSFIRQDVIAQDPALHPTLSRVTLHKAQFDMVSIRLTLIASDSGTGTSARHPHHHWTSAVHTDHVAIRNAFLLRCLEHMARIRQWLRQQGHDIDQTKDSGRRIVHKIVATATATGMETSTQPSRQHRIEFAL